MAEYGGAGGDQIAARQEPSVSVLRNILFGTMPEYVIPANPYNRCGHADGILVGAISPATHR